MSRKSKGIGAERELIHMLWGTGRWSAHRIAGSGSSKYPSPDIIAGNAARKVAIECKATKTDKEYIPKEDIEQLREFSALFGAEPWVGVRFDRQGWYFISLDDFKETKENFVVSIELAKQKGLLFEEVFS